MLLTLQDRHWCQDISGGQSLLSFHSTHTDQQREPRGVIVGAGGVLPVPPSGPLLAASREGQRSRNLRPAGWNLGPQSAGLGRDENSLRLRLAGSPSSARELPVLLAFVSTVGC